MEFDKWLRRKAIIKLVKQLKIKDLYSMIVSQGRGYSIHEDGTVTYGYADPSVKLTYDDLGYSGDQLSEFFSAGYLTDRKSSNKKIKRPLYTIEISSEEERLVIKTTNDRSISSAKKQYDAMDYVSNRRFNWGDKSISLNGSRRGFSHDEEMIEFKNIVDYSKQEDIVHIEKLTNHYPIQESKSVKEEKALLDEMFGLLEKIELIDKLIENAEYYQVSKDLLSKLIAEKEESELMMEHKNNKRKEIKDN